MPEPARPGSPSRTDSAHSTPWLAVGFDFGRRRIGMASGDSLTRAARPLGVIRRVASGIDWTSIERRLREIQPARLVVGLPYNADGTPGALAAEAQSFARELEGRFKIPVAMMDERWSSLEAAERLKSERQSGARKRRVQNADIDATAACIILERWLSQN